jgi:hypothetical protein
MPSAKREEGKQPCRGDYCEQCGSLEDVRLVLVGRVEFCSACRGKLRIQDEECTTVQHTTFEYDEAAEPSARREDAKPTGKVGEEGQ